MKKIIIFALSFILSLILALSGFSQGSKAAKVYRLYSDTLSAFNQTNKKVHLRDTFNIETALKLPAGAGLGKMLTSNTYGIMSWQNSIGAVNPDGILTGGDVVWLYGYTYSISAAQYYINGTLYTSPNTNVTLSAPAALDRIDVFVLNTSSTAAVVEGAEAVTPIEPDIDASTQLYLAFALVSFGTAQPVTPPVNNWIYLENTEWTTAVSVGTINPNSLVNPFAGVKDVEATNMVSGGYITFTSTPTMANYNVINFQIRSKQNWGTTKKLVLRWYNNSTALGTAVIFGSGSYGFVSTNTADYQSITINLSQFGYIAGANRLRITQSGSTGVAGGWYLDNIQLQGSPSIANNSWNLTGNSLTDSVSQFLGTTNTFPLPFRINNIERGRFNSSGYFRVTNEGSYNDTVYQISNKSDFPTITVGRFTGEYIKSGSYRYFSGAIGISPTLGDTVIGFGSLGNGLTQNYAVAGIGNIGIASYDNSGNYNLITIDPTQFNISDHSSILGNQTIFNVSGLYGLQLTSTGLNSSPKTCLAVDTTALMTIDSSITRVFSTVLHDEESWAAPTGISGGGHVFVIDSVDATTSNIIAWAYFVFNSDGSVVLTSNSVAGGNFYDVTTVSANDKFIIADGGTGIVFTTRIDGKKVYARITLEYR